MLTIRMGARRALVTVGEGVVGGAWPLASMVVGWLVPVLVALTSRSPLRTYLLAMLILLSTSPVACLPMCQTARWPS